MVGIGAMSLAACGTGATPAACPPTDGAGGCFAISGPAFEQLAVVSAAALPELADVPTAQLAARVFGGYELPSRARVWVVPVTVLHDGPMVAAARFVAADQGRARLAEVVALEETLSQLPEVLGGEVVLWANPDCRGDPSLACLFPDYEWAVQLPGGNFRLFDGEVVESLPLPSG
jgi:hypothetical protein